MMPPSPQKPAPCRTELPPAPIWHDILTLYGFTGAIVGAVGGCISACVGFAYDQYLRLHHGPNDFLTDYYGWKQLPEIIGMCMVSGVVPGFICGIVLHAIALLWPASKHPVRCGVMCASLGGTLCLLVFALVLDFPSVDLEMSLRFAATLSGGAFYGFTTAWIVQRLLRRYEAVMERRLRMSEECDAADFPADSGTGAD